MKAYNNKINIIGGSYLGLIAGIALAKKGFEVKILEFSKYIKHTKDSTPCKLLAISKGSLNIIKHHLNLNIISAGQKINFIRVLENGTNAYLDFDSKEIKSDSFGVMIEENIFYNLLLKLAYNTKKLKLIENFHIKDIENNGSLAKIFAIDGSCYESNIVLLCDGKNSSTRSLIGVECFKKNYHQTAIVCDVSHDLDHQGVAIENFIPEGPFAILPKKGGYQSSIVWTLSNDLAESVIKLTNAQQVDLIEQRFGDHLGKIRLASKLVAHSLTLNYATNYNFGRFYILGDALHSIHPLAGQGLNLSLRDCDFIIKSIIEANELGLDIGSNSIINKYHSSRSIDNQLLIESTNLLNILFSNHSYLIKKFRCNGLKLVNNLPWLKRSFMKYAAGLVNL